MALSLLFKERIYFVYVLYVYVLVRVLHAMARAEDTYRSRFPSHRVGPSDQTQIIRFGSKGLYLLRHH